MDYYLTAIFMSRSPVPVQALVSSNHSYSVHSDSYPPNQWALHDFVLHTISEIDLVEGILPVIEKALLRSPEIALPGEDVCRGSCRIAENTANRSSCLEFLICLQW
jgi:hypothetical protein